MWRFGWIIIFVFNFNRTFKNVYAYIVLELDWYVYSLVEKKKAHGQTINK